MDIDEAFSSESEEMNRSLNSEGRETITTESHPKTKNIRKKYQPLNDGGRVVRFEDNPAEYKRLRKKIQNRESATRVRGRKKNAFENLQQEVEFLRKENSHLQLANAKLETENKSLRDQVDFMRTLVRPAQRSNDPVDDYLASEVLTHPSPSQSHHQDSSESNFFEDFNWMRGEASSSSNLGWLGLAIFTIVVGVFVLPSSVGSDSFAALQVEVTGTTEVSAAGLLNSCLWYGKSALKYGIVLVYLWLMFRKVDGYLKQRKLKKI